MGLKLLNPVLLISDLGELAMQPIPILLPATVNLFFLLLTEFIKERLHNIKLEGDGYTRLCVGYIRDFRWVVLIAERGGLLLLFPTGEDFGPEGRPLVRTIRL